MSTSKNLFKKVTGGAKYTTDLHLPGMLVGKALYATYPRALINSLNTSAAEAITGVFAVVTHKDCFDEQHFGMIVKDQPIFAIDQVHYIGDMIAAVAAETEEIALNALDVIRVEYETIPGVYDPVIALEDPQILARPDLEDNLLYQQSVTHGEVEHGFAGSDCCVKQTYRTQCAEHLFLETESTLATWDGEMLLLWASGQYAHGDRDQIAEAFSMPKESVRVFYPYVGGAFGGKGDMHTQIQTAILARKAQRPVKMVRTRHESLFTHTKRPSILTTYELGARSDGTLQAMRVKVILDSGPYANLSPATAMYAAEIASGPYNIPHAQIDAYCVATNNLISGAFRGFGGPEVAFALEQTIDVLASRLGMDPLEFRLKNGIEKGAILPTGVVIKHDIGLKDTIRAAAKAANWHARNTWLEREPAINLRRGLGVTTVMQETGLGVRREDQSRVKLEIKPDGKSYLYSGSADFGQGPYSAQVMIISQVLGIDANEVEVVLPDTHIVPDASMTAASRSTYMVGNAVLNACLKIRSALFEIASPLLEVNPDQLELGDGKIWERSNPCNSTKISRLAQLAWEMERPLIAEGLFRMWHSADPSVEVDQPEPRTVFSYATHIAQVLVDTDTGQITVERIWAAHDVGKVIDLSGVKGQIDGGVVMGVGYALMEELQQKNGRLLNTYLSEYMAPLVTEIPEIEYRIIEVPEPSGPFGAKGVGEITTVPVAPAIANAVADAIGIRMTEIPMTPEKVWKALRNVDRVTIGH